MAEQVRVSRMTTAVVPRADRFAFWEAALSSSMYPVRLTPVEAPRTGVVTPDFRADFLRVDGGTARITSGSMDPVCGEATQRQARQRDAGELQIMFHDGGELQVESRQGRQDFSGESLLIQSDDEPNRHTHTERVPMLVLTVHSDALTVPVHQLRPLMFVPLGVDAGLRSLLTGAAHTARLSADTFDGAGISAYLTGVAELVLRTVLGRRPDHGGTTEVRRQQARDVLRARLADPHLSASVVAEELGISPRWLHQLFREELSIAEQITDLRMRRARALLRDELWTGEPIAAIARQCGILDHSQFSRSFRRATGSTPSDYRR